jgi:hypothetical protein
VLSSFLVAFGHAIFEPLSVGKAVPSEDLDALVRDELEVTSFLVEIAGNVLELLSFLIELVVDILVLLFPIEPEVFNDVAKPYD